MTLLLLLHRTEARDLQGLPGKWARKAMRVSEDENESGYDVVVVAGAGEAGEVETTYRSGLPHAAALRLAEELQAEKKVVRVMHVTPHGRFEVDRYPLR